MEPPLAVTRNDLREALLRWETGARAGLTRTADETAALPVGQVADESAAHLWSLLADVTAGRG